MWWSICLLKLSDADNEITGSQLSLNQDININIWEFYG